MDIKRKISEAQGLTPTEQQLGISALAMGEDVRGLSIKEFAARTNVSVIVLSSRVRCTQPR